MPGDSKAEGQDQDMLICKRQAEQNVPSARLPRKIRERGNDETFANNTANGEKR